MLSIKVHEFTKFASMRGPSGVSSGWLSLIWLLLQKVPWPSSSVHHSGFTPFPETPWRHSPGVPPKKVGRQEPPRPLPSGFLGDKTVRLAKSPSMLAAAPPVNRSSSTGEMGLAGGWLPCSSSTSMAWDFWLGENRRIAPGHSLKECHQSLEQ